MLQESLAGRVALVTGASSGVGRATAIALAQAGATVYAAARREEELRQLAAATPAIIAVPLDVTDRAAIDAAIKGIETRSGRLDLLVSNAGTNIRRRRVEELSPEDWWRVMETNATATFSLVQAGLPLLRAAGGLLIVIASVSSRWPDASGAAYQASKRAVLGFAHALALEERGIRVTSVLPGLIDTPLPNVRPQPPSAETRALALKSEDIAEICLFLARQDPRVCIPEIVVVPTALQRIGST